MLDKCHFIGIGGIGMSGLARLLLCREGNVTGSDMTTNAVIEGLVKSGATVYQGHRFENVAPDTTVIYSTDIKPDNPEYQAAMQYGCPILHRSELLQKLMESYCGLAVAGTHGKTTTSSLLTWVLEKSGFNPSYAVGGVVPQLNSNAGHGSGPYFVAEACESDGSFLNYTPYGAIITNIDFDHMDHYKTREALIEAFRAFSQQVISSSHLFWCGEDPHLKAISPVGISYGFNQECALRAFNFVQEGWGITFDIDFEGRRYHQVEVSLVGHHNALNALAVFGLALKLGVEEADIRAALRSFGGVLRRCERKGETHGINFFDDYAHHPTELKATLKGIRQAIGERRLIAVYQPHRYTRAKDCMGCYAGVFDDVDELFITEIYAAREQPIPGVTHDKIVEEVKKDLEERCQSVKRDAIAQTLSDFIRPHDVVITLGAGDVTKVSEEVLQRLKLKGPKKLKVGVIYGGVSVEHEISLLSVEYVLASLRAQYYDVEKIAITRDAVWLSGPEVGEKLAKWPGRGKEPKISADVLRSLEACDILFPVLHGTNGEDGTIQGFFEMLSKAYVGCDCRSSAISMDKIATKRIALQVGVPTLPFVSISVHEWKSDRSNVIAQVKERLMYPVFVKPAHLGSSIGVHQVTLESDLEGAIDGAFRFDTSLMVEQGAVGAREIEFAVLGNDNIIAYPPGEICTDGNVYDYDRKYGANAMKTTPSALLSEEVIHRGKAMVKKAYQAVGCLGMARIDTFLDRHDHLWLNEINPIPGFTKFSLYPQMCAVNGLKGEELVDRLIVLGLQRRRQLDRLEMKP